MVSTTHLRKIKVFCLTASESEACERTFICAAGGGHQFILP